MVDRIIKTTDANYWKVKAASETKDQKKGDDEKGRGQSQRDVIGETSDFVQLVSKDPKKYITKRLDRSQISSFTFRGVSTSRERAVLEIDISLANGTLIKGAHVAISREQGLKLLGRKPGENIVVDQIVQGTFLTIALPKKASPESTQLESAPAEKIQEKAGIGLAWYYYLGFGVLLLAVLALIYVFITL